MTSVIYFDDGGHIAFLPDYRLLTRKYQFMGTTTAMSARSLQYYVIATRWASDLEFFKVETAFLHRLIAEYFIRLGGPEYIENFRKTGEALLKLEEDRNRADKLLTEQLKHLELMAEDVIPEDVNSLSDKQIQIEYLVTDLVNEYRSVKNELFVLVKNVRKIKAG
jgi:hypothetical protein